MTIVKLYLDIVLPLAESGMTYRQAAEVLGVAEQTLRNWCNYNKCSFRRLRKVHPRVNVVTEEILLDAVRRGLTAGKLARELNLSDTYIRTRARVTGILLAGMGESRIYTRHSSPPSKESPPSPALVRLAEFDSVARRALARKSGQLHPGGTGSPDGEEEEF